MTDPLTEAPMTVGTLTARHRAYWRRTQGLTVALLLLWFAVTFLAGFCAAELNAYEFLGFPLGFYILAQGALIAYLFIIGIYVLAMNWLDRRYGVGERR
ncbi:hypothetical protein CJ010_06910 [Azoarcus sp. DD4]|uniref:DUF4212 domain-containing protein n=1 Tax=Azoarcus sp. DD4 TaxID=2027405 RepID=UPI00112CA847|nr:DUF4212 domain-containing protein [Azoarcus sp. DD4]MCM2290368.1 DUF4212 domain-containing protein [Sulfuritalea sp.]QDF96285.1 hypothetical protein CJ010_06910 [Azoarcus sp. DD4]